MQIADQQADHLAIDEAPGTLPVQQQHFAAIFGWSALERVRGFSPSEMALPNQPDVAYEFTVESRANVCIDMTSTYDGALILQSECGQPHTEVACNDDSPDTRHSSIRETLDAGTYYLLASGFAEARGNYSITTAIAAPLSGVGLSSLSANDTR